MLDYPAEICLPIVVSRSRCSGATLHSTSIKASKPQSNVVSPPGGRKSFDLDALEALKSSSHPDCRPLSGALSRLALLMTLVFYAE